MRYAVLLLLVLAGSIPVCAAGPTRVQSAAGQSASTTCSASLAGVVAGHGLIIGTEVQGGSVGATVTDNVSDSVVLDVGPVGTSFTQLSHVQASAGGSVTVQASATGATWCVIHVAEYNAAVTVDAPSKASRADISTPFTLSVTTTVAQDTVFAYAQSYAECTGVASPYGLILGSTAGYGDCSADDSVSATGTYTATFTDDFSGTTYNIAGAGYYTPSGSSRPSTLPMLGVGDD
jgi:hypothetical protein